MVSSHKYDFDVYLCLPKTGVGKGTPAAWAG